jgi:hypothetical protein
MDSVITNLEKALNDRNFAIRLLKTAIKQIKAKDFENAMKNNLDPSRLILNELHTIIERKGVKPLLQIVLRSYWNDIEDILTDVQKVYNLLCLNPELREILKRDEAKRYLNYGVASLYKRLYEWIWLGHNPFIGDNNAK